VYTTPASKVNTLHFGGRAGEAILQNPLKNSIYYHLQLTFKYI